MKFSTDQRRFARWTDPKSSQQALEYYMLESYDSWCSRVMVSVIQLTDDDHRWWNADDITAAIEKRIGRRQQRNVVSKMCGELVKGQMLIVDEIRFYDPATICHRTLLHYRLPTIYDPYPLPSSDTTMPAGQISLF